MPGKGLDARSVPTLGYIDNLTLECISHQGQIVMPAPARGFNNGRSTHLGQVRSFHGQFDILGANGIYPTPVDAHNPRHGGERHLPGQHEREGLEQQGEAGQLACPVWFDQDDLAIRQGDTGNTGLEMAFVLEEVQVLVTLDLRVVSRMHPFDTRIREAAARHEIEVDGQTSLFGIKINALDGPRIGNAQSRFKDVVLPGRSN